MGGAVAIWILLKFGQERWSGAWFICPMCKIAEDMVPPKPVVAALTAIAGLIPSWPIVPSPNIVDKAFRDKSYAELVRASPYFVDYEPRVATAISMLEATNFVSTNMEKISLPYLLLHGAADNVTDPNMSKEFFERSQSDDKTFKLYPDVYHSIYEDPDGEHAWSDTLEWLETRI